MDFLTLRTWCGEAPDYTNNVSKLEGICNTIMALKTEEEKAAFLIWCSAIQLQKADAEINHVTAPEPNDLMFHLIQLEYPANPSMHGMTLSLLGMFEDLYYASVAKAKQLLQVVDILLDNHFKEKDDVYFSYSSAPLNNLGPITYEGFKTFVTSNCNLLLDEVLIDILKRGVIERTKEDIKSGITLQQDPFPGLRRIEDAQLLDNVHNMNTAMIFGHLAEKYRNFATGQAQDIFAHDMITPTETTPTQIYISPYNLNERAKIFDMEGVADKPCICDPDCICYPVCTSDRTQNCLCEENGLFTRVMEGADIDELDVPDMVRSPASSFHESDSELDTPGDSESEAGSDFSNTDELATDLDRMTIVPADSTEPEVKTFRQIIEHPSTPSPMRSEFGDVLQSSNIHNGKARQKQLALTQSDACDPTAEYMAYLKAMREPWAKPCATPPKPLSHRCSIVRFLFPESKLAQKLTNQYIATVNAEAMLGPSKVTKPGKKRGLGRFRSQRIQSLGLRRLKHERYF